MACTADDGCGKACAATMAPSAASACSCWSSSHCVVDGLALRLREDPMQVAAYLAAAFATNFGLQGLTAVLLVALENLLGLSRAQSLAAALAAGNRNFALLIGAMAVPTQSDLFLFFTCMQFPIYMIRPCSARSSPGPALDRNVVDQAHVAHPRGREQARGPAGRGERSRMAQFQIVDPREAVRRQFGARTSSSGPGAISAATFAAISHIRRLRSGAFQRASRVRRALREKAQARQARAPSGSRRSRPEYRDRERTGGRPAAAASPSRRTSPHPAGIAAAAS